MSEERLVSLKNRWFAASVGTVLAIALFAFLVGFVWLPSAQPDAPFRGLWNAICSAAGVPRTWLASTPLPPTRITSMVIVTPQMLADPAADSIGRGATLALKCTMCHGARGLSEADSPNLAGQYAAVVYKELQDFKAGARTNAVMAPMVADLTDQDMVDLAAYYAYLPRLPGYHPTPWLEGESPAYLKAQLQAFASGTRHNDISDQMRNIARQMTPDEIDAAAQYYASQPPDTR
jgi:cytochrome c553